MNNHTRKQISMNALRRNRNEGYKTFLASIASKVDTTLTTELPKRRFFVSIGGSENEVTAEQYIDAERSAGFYPTKPGQIFATSSFSGEHGISGRIQY